MRVLARVTAGSRLHLGFYNINYGGVKYGGLGIYLLEPRVVVEAVEGDGSLEGFPPDIVPGVRRLLERLCGERPEFSLIVRERPPAHSGLGSFTQLTLSVAKLVSRLCERSVSLPELAKLTGRGRYSGVGLHAFFKGGFIVDGGRVPGEAYPPLILRSDFPGDWRVALVLPKAPRGLGDSDEEPILEELPSKLRESLSEPLISLAFVKIIRGVLTRNFHMFSDGVEKLQRRVGEIFSEYQGGLFSARETGLAVEALQKSGFRGAGQSSWGPVAYGFTTEEGASEKVERLRRILETENLEHVLVLTRARNRGAALRPSGTRL